MSNPRPLEITLVTKPEYPLETLYYVWDQSRTNAPMLSVRDIGLLANDDGPFNLREAQFLSDRGFEPNYEGAARWREYYNATIVQLITEEIPASENLDFVFALENIPIHLREQIVRHRVGVRVGDRVGFDIIPEEMSPIWSQSHRYLDMSKFYDEGYWYMPSSIAEGYENEKNLYRTIMIECQAVYSMLLKSGVPEEDARSVLPFAVTHRMTWKVNLKAIQHIVGKRSCWLMQLGVWEPIIVGMVEALKLEVHPVFERLFDPPCIGADRQFNACPFLATNADRATGRDPLPPCSLYLNKHREDALKAVEQHVLAGNSKWFLNAQEDWDTKDKKACDAMLKMMWKYRSLWNRDPVTGQLESHTGA